MKTFYSALIGVAVTFTLSSFIVLNQVSTYTNRQVGQVKGVSTTTVSLAATQPMDEGDSSPTVSAPIPLTQSAVDITSTSATLTGNVHPGGLPTTAWFRYIEGTNVTNCAQVSQGGNISLPTVSIPSSNAYTFYIANISSLKPNTTYTYCAVALNDESKKTSQQWVYANEMKTFTTANSVTISNINVTPGTSSAQITWNTNVPTDSFVYYVMKGGTSWSWQGSDLPLLTSHSVSIPGLNSNTVYEYYINAKNSDGKMQTSPVSTFTTAERPMFKISEISPFDASYAPGANIEFKIRGIEPDGTWVSADESFSVRGHVYYATKNEQYPGPLYSTQTSYDPATGWWTTMVPAPSVAGDYRMNVVIWCGFDYGKPCADRYGSGGPQVQTYVPFTVKGTYSGIKVTYPNGGEILSEPLDLKIQWSTDSYSSERVFLYMLDQDSTGKWSPGIKRLNGLGSALTATGTWGPTNYVAGSFAGSHKVRVSNNPNEIKGICLHPSYDPNYDCPANVIPQIYASDDSDTAFKVNASIQPVLDIALDSNTPPSATIAPNQTGIPFTAINISAQIGDVYISKLLIGTAAESTSSLANVQACASTQCSDKISSANSNYYGQAYEVTFSTPLIITKGATKTLTFKADTTASASGVIHLSIIGFSALTPSADVNSSMPIFGNKMFVNSPTSNPDLVITGVLVSKAYPSGENLPRVGDTNIVGQVSVKNQGTGNAYFNSFGSTVSAYIHASPLNSGSIGIAGSGPAAVVSGDGQNIAPGESRVYNFYTMQDPRLYDNPEFLGTAGNKTLYFMVDRGNVTSDSNRSNNVYQYNLTVSAGGTTPKIEVTSPKGGEKWEFGTKQTINWVNSDGYDSNRKVLIHISQAGAATFCVIENNIPDTGTYNWTIPTYTSPLCYGERIITVVRDGGIGAKGQSLPINIVAPSGGDPAAIVKTIIAPIDGYYAFKLLSYDSAASTQFIDINNKINLSLPAAKGDTQLQLSSPLKANTSYIIFNSNTDSIDQLEISLAASVSANVATLSKALTGDYPVSGTYVVPLMGNYWGRFPAPEPAYNLGYFTAGQEIKVAHSSNLNYSQVGPFITSTNPDYFYITQDSNKFTAYIDEGFKVGQLDAKWEIYRTDSPVTNMYPIKFPLTKANNSGTVHPTMSELLGGITITPTPTPVPTPKPNPISIPISTADSALLERIQMLEYRVTELERSVVETEKSLVTTIDPSLTNRVAGKILLQVEGKGEAWYVDKDTSKKFYLKDGDTAYAALQAFGLGISNDNLAKIPVATDTQVQVVDTDGDGLDDKLEEALGTDKTKADTDGDSYPDSIELASGYSAVGANKLALDSNLTNRLQGKILLQVEGRGQAWYVIDGKRYYLKDGASAYAIMRAKSLGITNNDLRKINVGEFE